MKRKLALLLTLTMTMASFTSFNAFADNPVDASNALTGIGANDAVEGDAYLNAVNTSVYRVILPTTAATGLDYVADPQGLATMSEETASLDDLSENAGYVYAKNSMSIANRSSKDIVVTTTVTGVASNVTGAATLDTVANVTADNATGQKVALAVAVGGATFTSAEDGTEFTDGEESPKFKVETDWSDKAYAVPATGGVNIPVTLKKADYVAKKTVTNAGATNETTTYSYELKDDSVGGGVSFGITGFCTKNGTWVNATKNGTTTTETPVAMPTVKVAYAFSDVVTTGENPSPALGDDDTYKAGGEPGVEGFRISATPATPATPTDVLSSDGTNDIVIYDSDIAANAVITVTPVQTSGTNKAAINGLDSTNYTITAGSKLELKAAWIAGMASSAKRGTGTYKVTWTGNSTGVIITIAEAS